MSQPPYWKRALATGVRFAQFQARGQLGTVIGGLVATVRHRNEELGRFVRSGADRQFAGLGLVTKTDLVTFERRMRPTPAKNNAQAKKKITAKRRDGVRKSPTAPTTKRAR